MSILAGSPTGGGRIDIPVGVDASYSSTPPDNATVGVTFQPDGRILIDNEDSTQFENYWSEAPQAGIGAGYQVRSLASGKVGVWDTEAAADDTWVTMSIDRTWSITSSGVQSVSSTFEIRPIGGGSALDSETISASIDISV